MYPFRPCDRYSREDLATTAEGGVILQEHWPRRERGERREPALVERSRRSHLRREREEKSQGRLRYRGKLAWSSVRKTRLSHRRNSSRSTSSKLPAEHGASRVFPRLLSRFSSFPTSHFFFPSMRDTRGIAFALVE